MSFCLECGSPLPNAPMVINLQNDSQTGSLPGGAPTNFGANRQTANFANNQPNFLANQPPARPAGKSKAGLIIGGIVALLVLLGIAGAAIVAYNLTSKKTVVKEETPTPTVSPAVNASKSPSPKAPIALKDSPTPVNNNPQASFTPPLEPTKRGTFTVNANSGWQLSDIDVVASEQFTTNVQGLIDLAGIKASVSPTGVNDAKTKARRIYQEYPTGALLMRTRYADGTTSNTISMTTNGANGSWQNFPNEIGKLEFCINDNAPQQNGGQFTVTKVSTTVPKPKK